MNKYEAEKIINAYGGAVAKGVVKRISWLPCSKAKIKQAYFIYIDAIINDYGNLPDDKGQPLVLCYSMLKMFVDDDEADRLDAIKARIDAKTLDWEKPEDKTIGSEYFSYSSGVKQKDGTYIGGMMDGDLYNEINEFIGECLEKNKVWLRNLYYCMLDYYLCKLAQINYKIAVHPERANIRLTSQADKILVISSEIVPEKFKTQFTELTDRIDASYKEAEHLGKGLTPYRLNGIYNKTATKYIKLLLDIEEELRE